MILSIPFKFVITFHHSDRAVRRGHGTFEFVPALGASINVGRLPAARIADVEYILGRSDMLLLRLDVDMSDCEGEAELQTAIEDYVGAIRELDRWSVDV